MLMLPQWGSIYDEQSQQRTPGNWYLACNNVSRHLSCLWIYIQKLQATNQLVVILVNYCIFEQLNHLYITFDIDVNGGESDMKNILCSSIGKKIEHDEDVYLVFLELRCFSSMLPSMPKGEIVSMNADAITMGENCRTLI